MKWIGKAVLGALGLAIRGPAGAIGGALIGAIIDAAPDEWRRIFTGTVANDEDVAAHALLGLVAVCDGPVNDAELSAFASFMDRRGLHGKAREDAVVIFNIAGNSPYSFEQLAVSFFRLTAYEDAKLSRMVLDLLDMAASDGPVNRAEDRLAHSAAEIFLIGRDEYASIRGRYKTASADSSGKAATGLAKCYQILGASPSDSDEAIKKRYQKLASDFHPDKIASKELPEEFIRFANSKLAEINQAYDSIRKSRGMA